ncbi:phage gp6-like head-tail connector protein [Clostridium sp. 19966]|uniref:head-tail connector protein n=1 Tax=Clostridium sp. 19966 TaxID=2768166 RepID=UPI0028DE2D2B|nr:head-tail connector protein [Clostridium sp. 19966]MDT8718988.1 phage gp6-like head-tail connector protein [Clostridium sp. 19966]
MTLEDAKNYLRVDYSDDDIYIQSLIDTVQIYLDSCCGIAYKTDVKLLKLADLAMYKLVNDMYGNKSQYIDGNMQKDKIIESIFLILSLVGDADA